MATAVDSRLRAWHESLEHTSELELWLHAPTWPALVAEAGRALGEQLVHGVLGRAGGPWRRVSVRGAERATLLAAWVNELLFHAEAEWWVPIEFADVQASDTEIHARVRGAVVTEPPAPVRAAEPSAVRIQDVAGWLEARVILDT
ncbi:MAG TPA: archease [Gemmatimonadales bacterium]|nr:archease [Gemmatimonadales bacterium]